MKKEWIAVNEPRLKEGSVTIPFLCSPGLRQYFSSLESTMDYGEVDLSAVPTSILCIPLLTNIAPIAWLRDANIYVQELDRDFWLSLQRIQLSFRQLFPEFEWAGDIITDPVKTPFNTWSGRKILLFSGGIDSLASYVRHKSENLVLTTIWGADVPLQEHQGWLAVREDVLQFANKHHAEARFIRSDLRAYVLEGPLPYGWWGKFQHGLGLLGSCAPLAYAEGLDTIYIASSYHWSVPWGSHLLIDGNLVWAGTNVVHDGTELSRIDKTMLVAKYLEDEGPDQLVRVCWHSSTGKNCSACGKCSKTIIDLAVAGIYPNRHGFNANVATFDHIRRNIEDKTYTTNPLVLDSWKKTQEQISSYTPVDIAGISSFLQWLKEHDLSV